MTQTNLASAERLTDFLTRLEEKEKDSVRLTAAVSDFKLNPDGSVELAAQLPCRRPSISKSGLEGILKSAEVPSKFYSECPPNLQAAIVAGRLAQLYDPDHRIQIAILNDSVISFSTKKVSDIPRLRILRAVQDAVPGNLSEDPKILIYNRNGTFDASIISAERRAEIRSDDTLAFGVNLLIGADGAVQIQSASYRLVCQNGMITRICSGADHRLKRPGDNSDSREQFLERVTGFAKASWAYWEQAGAQLKEIAARPIYVERHPELILRLRARPFFLSASIATRVVRRLSHETNGHPQSATLFHLICALSYVGTHDASLSSTYRYRLRTAAGEITRMNSSICSACKSVVLS
jgi:hypothetical protein